MRELHENGFVLLRRVIPKNTVFRYRDALDKLYETTAGNGDIPWFDFSARSGLDFEELFDRPELRTLAESFHGRYVVYNGLLMSVGKRANTMSGIGLHTDGLIQGTSDSVLCYWAPLHDCGVTAPGLSVVRASKDAVIRHLRKYFSHPIPGWQSMTEWDSTNAFRVETVERELGQIWSPELHPGDVMVFTNWTIHGSHVTPQMTGSRSAAILRLQKLGFVNGLRSAAGKIRRSLTW